MALPEMRRAVGRESGQSAVVRGAGGCDVTHLALTVALSLTLSGCAADTMRSWAVRSVGAVGALAVHEACHVALTAALGGETSLHGTTLIMSGLSAGELKGVAWAGNACTAILAETLLLTGAHRKSDLAWGAVAFHAGNSLGYAFAPYGDRAMWTGEGGSLGAWQGAHIGHAIWTGARLLWPRRVAPPALGGLDR